MAICRRCKEHARWVQKPRGWVLMDLDPTKETRHVCGRVDRTNTNLKMHPSKSTLSAGLREEARRIAGLGGWV